jgi:hypothetical protein
VKRRMSWRDDEGEKVPYMPCEMFAAGENHPTVAKALALERLCGSGAVAFARGRKGYLLEVAGAVWEGLSAGGIDGGDLAGGGRVVEGSDSSSSSGMGSSSSGGGGSDGVWTEDAGMVDCELDGGGDGNGLGEVGGVGGVGGAGGGVGVVVECSVVDEHEEEERAGGVRRWSNEGQAQVQGTGVLTRSHTHPKKRASSN